MTMQAVDSQSPRPRGKDRSEYLRAYYRKHRERLLAYQREYTREHKRKLHRRRDGVEPGRLPVKEGYNVRDIMRANPDQVARMIERIVTGERFLAS